MSQSRSYLNESEKIHRKHTSSLEYARLQESCNPIRFWVSHLLQRRNMCQVLSRPDILHAVSKLSQRNTDPHAEHETAARHVLRYLSSTLDLCIEYRRSGERVSGFADSDWANDSLDRKSYSGYAFFLAGGVFSWTSSKQSIVSLSSTEAEYVALSTAAREAVYLRKLLDEMGWQNSGPMTIY
ncbi:uncharacterized protein [Drosophila takahashii]|uniref:uncharacterized protein n=1 Tax=Drosophila takahashii TaxID=29030 RepID=UPI0038994057